MLEIYFCVVVGRRRMILGSASSVRAWALIWTVRLKFM